MYSSVNEGVLGAAIKSIGDLFSTVRRDANKVSTNYSYSSSAKAASKLIAVYPLLTSRSISMSTAQLVSKYIEQQGCYFLQIILQAYNATDAANGIEYLKTFHQNLNIGGAGLDAMAKAMNAYMDTIISNSNKYNNESTDMYEDEFEVSARDLREIMEMLQNRERFDTYDINLNPVSINDYIVSESMGTYRVSIKPYIEAVGMPNARNPRDYNTSNNKDRYNSSGGPTTQLVDNNVKKLNNGVPSLLLVRFFNTISNQTTQFIIGVKSLIVPVNSGEILRRIVNDDKDGKHLINLLRTISGEKSVWDFVLGISTINDDIDSIKTKGTKYEKWQMFKNRGEAAKEAVKRGRVNAASAITTVVLSQDDCDMLFREENIDITNPKIARHFMNTYNLMGIVICDDSIESMKYMSDNGNNMFEELAYSTLSRETEDQYKKIINLIDKAH